MSAISDYAERVLSEFSRSLTDQVFLLIQNDRTLMHDYLRLIESDGLDVVNQQIGKEIKRRFRLSNAPERQRTPLSTLIQSHQRFQ